MKKSFIVFLIYVVMAGLMQNVTGQEDDCNKTKVGVTVEIVPDAATFDRLENDFGSHPRDEWNSFVAEKFVQILSEYEPDITFLLPGENGGDYHYHFEGQLTLNTVGEGNDEHTVYWTMGSLISNCLCVPNRNWILDVYDGKDPDLVQSIKNMVSQFWPMERNIIAYELDHPSPPRDPELKIKIEKDYISPVDKESRKTKVNAKVIDCRGNQVCDIHGHGQPVYYQDNIDRLDLKIGNCEGGYQIGNFMVIVTNKQCTNEGSYTLEKGVEAEKKNLRFKTCLLGSESLVTTEEELIIRGLEIEVKPDRKAIDIDEHTNIVITLNETDPDGTKYPIEGKELKVTTTGILNGTIKPKNGYTTGSDGKIELDYKAGNKDEKITVTASFQPEDYPDKAEGKGTVTVKPPEYDAFITISKWATKESLTETEDSKQDQGCETYTKDKYTLNERTDANINVQLKLMYAADMPIFNQRWEYYQPVRVSISSFTVAHDETHYMYGNVTGMGCAVGGYETNAKTIYHVTAPEIYEPPSAPWIVAFDNETGKAVKMMPGGYSIKYGLKITEIVESRKWDEDGEGGDTQEDYKTSENHSFGVGPVEDPIPDPTYKSAVSGIYDYLKHEMGDSVVASMPPIPPVGGAEKVPEINPDLLVQFGDGINSFGGRGHDEEYTPKENGYDKTASEYEWQMTRKKKK